MVEVNGVDYSFKCDKPENFEFGFYVLTKKEGNIIHLMLDKRRQASNQMLTGGYSLESLRECYVDGNKQHFPRLADKLIDGYPNLAGGAYCFANDKMFMTTDRNGFWCQQMNRKVLENCIYKIEGLTRPIQVLLDWGNFGGEPASEFLKNAFEDILVYEINSKDNVVPMSSY